MDKVKMYIEGIDKLRSASELKSALESLGEIQNIKVDSKSGTAEMETTQINERLKTAVEDLGCSVKRIVTIS